MYEIWLEYFSSKHILNKYFVRIFLKLHIQNKIEVTDVICTKYNKKKMEISLNKDII